MITAQSLERALQAALPAHLHTDIADLVRVLTQATQGESASDVSTMATPTLMRLLEALAGQKVTTRDSIFSFGEANAVGNVQVQDVAGNNIIKLTINLYHSNEASQNSDRKMLSPSAERLPGRRKPIMADIDRVTLHQLLTQHFNNQELEGLCYSMNIDLENFAASGKDGKARDLIMYTERHGRYEELVEQFFRLRSHLFPEP